MDKRYELAENEEQYRILQSAEWILKTDCKYKDNADDGESSLLSAIVSSRQHFGYTDYKDHRQDKLQDIKEAILKSYKTHTVQRIHLYQDVECQKPCQVIACWGYLGGISSEFIA